MDCIYTFGFLNNSNCCVIELPKQFIIYLYKRSNYNYFYKAFFYNSKNIYHSIDYRTKSKLYGAVQELLKQELYHVLQY